MTRFAAFTLAFAAVTSLASAALAQPAAGGPRAACAADIAKLCPGAQPGNGSIRTCMMSHADQLSAGCKAAIAAARAAHGH